MLEEQSLASQLNNSLPKPLDLSDFQPISERSARKIRNQRIIAENIAFATQFVIEFYSPRNKDLNKIISKIGLMAIR